MTQFTSHIDFSLTKKRLQMMGKRISRIKVGAIWLFLLPTTVVLTIIFSADLGNNGVDTQEFENDSEFIEAKNYYPAGPNPLFADTTLYLKRSEMDIPPRTYYTENGELFSGSQNWFYEQTGSLDQTIEIENGIVITSTRFNNNGDEIIKSEIYDQIKDTSYHHFYRNGELRSTSKEWSYKNGSLVYSYSKGVDTDGITFYSEMEKDLTSNYQQSKMYKNGLLFFHMYRDDEISTIKSYYDDGQLMSEGTAKNNGNLNYWSGNVIKHGIQLTYLENGELVRKEVWKDGEIIEEIK